MSPQNSKPNVLFRTSARLLFPVVLIFSTSHLINAERQPGEGFSSGLLVGLAIFLLYVGLGVHEVDVGMPRLARFGVSTGFALLLAAGAVGLLLGDGFLRVVAVKFPFLSSDLEISTTLAFEAGIFLLLSGGTLGMFRAVGLEEEEQP